MEYPSEIRDRSRRRQAHRARFPFRAEDFVAVAGEPISFAVERDADVAKVDHFWIIIQAGEFGPLRISINTYSLKHAAHGFDPRMRVALLASTWTSLPPSGVVSSAGFDYAKIEGLPPGAFRAMERPAVEALLAERMDRAIFVEGWGAFYLRDGLGIHQVHSRRASRSVLTDYVGRDGAVRFYYRHNSASEMVLFKYCGQV